MYVAGNSFNRRDCHARFKQEMPVFLRSFHFPSARGSAGRRVRHYAARHPEVSREQFLLDVVGGEIDFLERRGGTKSPGLGSEGQNRDSSFDFRPRLTAEDVRLHAWLSERLAAVHRERHGLWGKIRAFLFGRA